MCKLGVIHSEKYYLLTNAKIMQTKKYLLALIFVILLSGCTDKIHLINIEVKDNLSTTVQIVISPSDSYSGSTTNSETNSEKEEYFQKNKKEFESCGFKVEKNLRYDDAGVSGSKSFSSRIDIEQAFSCLKNANQEFAPIKVSYPTKTENLFQTNYELELSVINPDIIFALSLNSSNQDNGLLKMYEYLTDIFLVKEIRVTLPGRIVNENTKNEYINIIFNKKQTNSGIIHSVKKIKSTDSEDIGIKRVFEQLDIDTRGFDYKRLISENKDEASQAYQELAFIFKNQKGIDIINNQEELSKYIRDEIPTYTTIVINSSKSKININQVITVTLGILPFIIGFVVFLYNSNKKTIP